MKTMVNTLRTSVLALAVFMIITGVLYPGLIWAFAVLTQCDQPPLDLIAPTYTDSTLFQARPSASDHATMPAAASNFGPTNAQLHSLVTARDSAFRASNDVGRSVDVPADMVYASGSGIDPHISLASALLQRRRIARLRGLSIATVDSLIKAHIEPPQFSVFGTALVNVVTLNDALARK